jgi:Kef-type K+ transport system membrane component KefB
MSITAFPVLARILIEHRMLKTPIGGLAMASAGVDDVTAWGLIAVATALAGAASGYAALVVVGASAAFAIGLFVIGRPLLARMSTAYDEVGRVPALWLGIIFVAVLLAAYVAGWIGVAPVLGAFLIGMIMPRHAGLTDDVRDRLEDFVVIVLLPLFFVVTGLRTEINALNRWELWLITLGLIVIAIVGKWIGAALAARYGGFAWRESNVIGALMNTRGLTELIVLNIGLHAGLISTQLFSMLVVMALVTTFMAGPALNLLNADGRLSEPVEDTLRAAGLDPDRAERPRTIVVAPQDEANTEALLALGGALAKSEPPRELLLTRLLVPQRYATGISYDARELAAATDDVRRRRDVLVDAGVAARVAAYTSPDPGEDLVRVAEDEAVDLVLLDGRRPLLGAGVPKGEVGEVLATARSDVAVLVDREDRLPAIDATRPVVVPFGGAEHDWAALELGVWIASAYAAPLRLLGAASSITSGERDASRLLASASLVVQQLTGIVAEPTLVEPGEVGTAAEGAGLLVVGLSERWREEGLGALRAELVKSAPAPILLVRRGERPGVLGARDDMTRLRWSVVAPPPVAGS